MKLSKMQGRSGLTAIEYLLAAVVVALLGLPGDPDAAPAMVIASTEATDGVEPGPAPSASPAPADPALFEAPADTENLAESDGGYPRGPELKKPERPHARPHGKSGGGLSTSASVVLPGAPEAMASPAAESSPAAAPSPEAPGEPHTPYALVPIPPPPALPRPSVSPGEPVDAPDPEALRATREHESPVEPPATSPPAIPTYIPTAIPTYIPAPIAEAPVAPFASATPQPPPAPPERLSQPAPASASPASPSKRAAVDPALVGTWESRFKTDQGAWEWVWTIRADGGFRFSSAGPIPLPDETGHFTAERGTFRRTSDNGRVDEGTYALEGGALKLSAPGFSQSWSRK